MPYKEFVAWTHIRDIIDKKMLQKKEKLVLVEIKPIEITDKDTGAKLKRFKYTFLNEEGAVRTGYADTEKLKERVVNTDKFNADKSHEYESIGRVWNDVLTWRLVI